MVAPLPKEDTSAVTDILDDWFIEHGIPVSIRTDGGPQFRGPFKTWCAKHRIKHELSSAYSHELNGHAECAVREMKKLLTKTPSYIAFRNALRGYRNCPRYDGLSPAQWCVGRRQRTSAVAFPAAYDRIPDATIALHEAKRRKKAGKLRSYKIKSSRHWAQLRPGQVVTAQNPLTGRWDQRATVVDSRENGRSYNVRIDGHAYLRNRRFLRPNRLLPRQIDMDSTTEPPDTTEVPQDVVEEPGVPEEPKKPAEPRKSYPTRIWRQRELYQAAKPKRNRRN